MGCGSFRNPSLLAGCGKKKIEGIKRSYRFLSLFLLLYFTLIIYHFSQIGCLLFKVKDMTDHDEMDEAIKYALRFGETAIRKGFISRQQLREALEEQVSNEPYLRLRPHKLIGEILQEHGWITSAQIEIVLQELRALNNII